MSLSLITIHQRHLCPPPPSSPFSPVGKDSLKKLLAQIAPLAANVSEDIAMLNAAFAEDGDGAAAISVDEVDAYNKEVKELFATFVTTKVMPSKSLAWWFHRREVYPRIFKIFSRIAAVQPSSIASERCFSLLKHIMGDRRASLSSQRANGLVVATSYYRHIERLVPSVLAAAAAETEQAEELLQACALDDEDGVAEVGDAVAAAV